MRELRAQRLATRLRRDMTDAERHLWRRLRDRQILGFRFRRQVPVGAYVADFACLESRLVVVLDGGQHLESAHDVERDAWPTAQGYHVLRFWNDAVFKETDAVLEVIASCLRPHPGLPPQAGEGEKQMLPRDVPPPPRAGEAVRVWE